MLPPADDTSAAARAHMVELLRRATPAQKLAKLLGFGRAVNELALAELRRRYPDATPRELELRLASRSIDRQTMIRAFGWDPDVRGR